LEKLSYSYLKYYGTYGEPDSRAIEPVNPPVCEDEHCIMPKYKKSLFISFTVRYGDFIEQLFIFKIVNFINCI
jgi:hypothetical protein